jgi:hypothetical protein
MSACNERPPKGHPWHGTLVACHYPAGHKRTGHAHSWEIPDRVEPWAAKLLGGPAASDTDRVFMVGPVWTEIRLAPTLTHTRGDHWVIVGGSGIPDDPGVPPWPGEVRYLLAEVAEALDLEDSIRWVALYQWARPASTFPPDSPDDSRRYWGD